MFQSDILRDYKESQDVCVCVVHHTRERCVVVLNFSLFCLWKYFFEKCCDIDIQKTKLH